MRLYEEIIQSEGFTAFAGARVLFLPLRAVYCEGVKGLGDFSCERVEVCFSSCAVEIEGEELSIAKLLDGALWIPGTVVSVRALEGGRP